MAITEPAASPQNDRRPPCFAWPGSACRAAAVLLAILATTLDVHDANGRELDGTPRGDAARTLRHARLAPTLARVQAGPCDDAVLLQTASGQVYETESAARLVRGNTLRVSGTIYPDASICRLYPWLRLDPDAATPSAHFEIHFLPSIGRLLQQAAARATARSESGLPLAPGSLPQIEVSGDPSALRALGDALHDWSAWAFAPGWHRLPRAWR